MRSWTNTWVEEFPLRRILPLPPNSLSQSSSVIAPNSVFTHIQPHGVDLNEYSNEKLKSGEAAFYIYGEATYTDIFDEEHTTEFCLFLNEDFDNTHNLLKSYMSGNVST